MSDTNGPSLFARSMKCQEEAIRMHMMTDDQMTATRREIILNVLKQIREDPPAFLTECPTFPGNHRNKEDLIRTITDLEKMTEDQ